jgi:hypothetical protein
VTVEYVAVQGPLEPERMAWVADLYGQADPKFRREDILDHLYRRSPAGPGLHCFAVDGGRAVGHCSVVPQRARLGARELRCGKLEALWIEESHRGVREDGERVVSVLLARLYEAADERGFELVHGSATPHIGHVIRFTPLEGVGEPSAVSIVRADALGTTALRARGRVLGLLQTGVRELALLATKAPRGTLREADPDDVDLVAAPPPPDGRWTVLAEDGWDWYRASPLVRVLELGGPSPARALVQLPGSPREPVRIAGWRSDSPGARSAVGVLGAAGRLARREGAATVRFQPWGAPAGDGELARACRLLGWVRRADLTTLWVRTHDPALARAEAVVSTPMLQLAF